LQVGLALVATRFVVGQAGPITLAFLRYLLAMLFLLPVVLAMRTSLRLAPRDRLPVWALGLVQFALLVYLLNAALLYTPAGRAAVIFTTFPLLTLAGAVLLGRERASWTKLAGALLSLLAVAVTLADALTAATTAGAWKGDLLAFGAAVCGASCSLGYRPYLQRYPTLAVSFHAMAASVVVLGLAAASEGLWQELPAFGPLGWGAVVFIGLSSGIGYFLWLHALRHLPASRVTVFLGLSPVTAALAGWLLLDDPFTWHLGAGALLLSAGLALAFRR
jgi:drug/metabolite transporter (DMT)-like permease